MSAPTRLISDSASLRAEPDDFDDERGSGVVTRPPTTPTVREIFDAHGRFVWRTVRHMGVAESDIADVVQNVFLTVHRRLGTFEGRARLRTWLYAICMRSCSEYRRRAHRKHERLAGETSLDEYEDDERTPDVTSQQRNMLLVLLDLLDEDKRAALVLYEVEGFKLREIAEILDCPPATVYSRLCAAREVLALAVSSER